MPRSSPTGSACRYSSPGSSYRGRGASKRVWAATGTRRSSEHANRGQEPSLRDRCAHSLQSSQVNAAFQADGCQQNARHSGHGNGLSPEFVDRGYSGACANRTPANQGMETPVRRIDIDVVPMPTERPPFRAWKPICFAVTVLPQKHRRQCQPNARQSGHGNARRRAGDPLGSQRCQPNARQSGHKNV